MIRSITRIGDGLRRHYKPLPLASIQGRTITTDIDSCRYVLNQSDIQNQSALFSLIMKNQNDIQNQSALFSLIMKRYCDTVKTPHEKILDVHQTSLRNLLEKNATKAALKYIDLNIESGYVMPGDVFTEFVHHCYHKRSEKYIKKKILYAKKMHKRLLSFIERFTKNNPAFCPNWNLCFYMLNMSLEAQNSELAYHALHYIRKFIAATEIPDPCIQYFVEEELLIQVLHLAGETRNVKLFDIACVLLDLSLCQNTAQAETFIAKIHAYAYFGNLKLAHNTLFELESLYRGATQEATDLFSPFFALNPLAMAYSQNGCGTLDYIYYQLEELSKENPQYKSLAALNCIILGYANVGDDARALQTFEAIGNTFGLTPDIDSYNCLISAYLMGEEREEALQLYENFIYLGVRPNAMTYELLFDAHTTARDSKSALSIIEEMGISGLEPTQKALKKIYTCAIMEDNDASKDHARDLAIKFNIPMSEKVFRERNEYAYLAPPKSYEEQTTLSWEYKFKSRAKKVSLRRIRRFEAREDQQEEFPFFSDGIYLI